MASFTLHLSIVVSSVLIWQIHSHQLDDYHAPPPSMRLEDIHGDRGYAVGGTAAIVNRRISLEVSPFASLIRRKEHAAMTEEMQHAYAESVDRDWFVRQGELAKLHKQQSASGLLDDGSATKNVWIQGLPRTGSSALMSFLSLAAENEDIFGIYEPCFPTDTFRGQPQNAQVCPEVLAALQRCDFSDIGQLHSWNYSCKAPGASGWSACDGHNHMSLHSHEEFEHAADDCGKAKLLLWKTTTMPIDMHEALEKGIPNLRTVNLVRDPRALLASALKLWGVDPKAGRWTNNTINDPHFVCKELNQRWLEHPRIHQARFEDMVSQPVDFFAQIYNFLDLPFAPRNKAFIQAHFGNDRCREVLNNNCRKRPEDSLTAWRQVPELVNVTSKMQQSPDCISFFQRFGYKF